MSRNRTAGETQKPIETYGQAIDFIFGRINYERAHSGSYSRGDFKLERMRRLLDCVGNPQDRLPAVHIAGTKGKGSTAAMIARILTAAGWRAGLFTSPHVSAFEERMQVDGVQPAPEVLLELVNCVAPAAKELDALPEPLGPTYFEIATALAWLYFLRQQADVAVMEVGLGGRLDSTNVCNPEVCVITSISRDHMAFLGSRLSQIAWEKGGIIKPGVPVISGVTAEEARQTIEAICRERGAPLLQIGRDFDYVDRRRPAGSPGGPLLEGGVDIQFRGELWPEIRVPVLGEHQAHNAALALAAAETLRQAGRPIAPQAICEGLASVQWPLRIEIFGRAPTVIVDAAHNWASIAALLKTLGRNFFPRRRILIFGTSRDKDVSGLLRQVLPQFDAVIFTQYLNNPRAVPPFDLHRQAGVLGDFPAHLTRSPVEAWTLARRIAASEDLICVTGSFFLAAEMRDILAAESAQGGDALAEEGIANCKLQIAN